jgi:Fur family ferric uptake transcriptional regulator
LPPNPPFRTCRPVDGLWIASHPTVLGNLVLVTIIAKLGPVSRPVRQRATQQGSAVRRALLDQGGFRSAQDIYAALRAGGRNVGLSTVYRHLQSFVEQGLADSIQSPDGETAYRFCGESAQDKHHHHHLVCRRCGRAEEVEGHGIERWATETAAKYGYTEVDHVIELFGLCGDCSRAAAPDTPATKK